MTDQPKRGTTLSDELTLSQARLLVDTEVVYTNTGEVGTITGVSDRYVFVRYHGDPASKATRPELLRVVVP